MRASGLRGGRLAVAWIQGLLWFGALVVAGCRLDRRMAPPPSGTVVVRGDIASGDGTIRYYPIEGGFHAIAGADGKVYDPMNLPAEFQRDGVPVSFTGRLRHDMGSIHMVGTIIQLTDIRRR